MEWSQETLKNVSGRQEISSAIFSREKCAKSPKDHHLVRDTLSSNTKVASCEKVRHGFDY